METVLIDGVPVAVKEVARPQGWHCRLLEAKEAQEYILEYVVSLGPYKIDVERFHRLTTEQVALYRSGQLELASLAKDLAHE
jgi:hypothetical protein